MNMHFSVYIFPHISELEFIEDELGGRFLLKLSAGIKQHFSLKLCVVNA